ncbi:MAG: indolepyruvate oxidoreductase subunit beta [Bryobacterales bacterium]|nr:indolepyruvate oxidoreductase subunit beta [Bryobacterales bacterium]
MRRKNEVTSVVIAGLGGQGVLKASDILAGAAFRTGLDVKKSEIHGMSQRGGSVSSDVRFGAKVLSPMVPDGAADYLLVVSPGQEPACRHQLRAGGVIIPPEIIDERALPHKRSFNVALLGVLSTYLAIPEKEWHAAIRAHLPEHLHEINLRAFAMGRAARSL